MTPLVTAYGLRACILGCRGRCVKATEHPDPRDRDARIIKPSRDCVLMSGPPPVPGETPRPPHWKPAA